jgi:alanyl-tRNA synthetase
VAEENGLAVDKAGFEALMEEQKERGRRSFKHEELFALEKSVAQVLKGVPATDFVGYQHTESDSEIAAIIRKGEQVSSITDEEALVLIKSTPFYAEGGGQVSDTGTIEAAQGSITVTEVRKVGAWIVHQGRVQGTLSQGQQVTARVDPAWRQATAANHTATHLLHRALRDIAGEHAQQKGSLVEPERLRFDFSHFAPLTQEQLGAIEEEVNRTVWSMLPVKATVTTLNQAKKAGAMALFGEKYGDKVRMVEVKGFSRELCGGTHVQNTGEIGLFKIISEGSVGTGLRRIEALTGPRAWSALKAAETELRKTAGLIKTNVFEVSARVEALALQLREKERELENLKSSRDRDKASDVLERAVQIDGINILVTEMEAADMNSLRQNAELLKDKLGLAVVVLGARLGEKAGLVVFVAKDLIARGFHAGEIVGAVAPIVGGGGGGRPDMAQAGGKDPDKLDMSLQKAREIIEKTLAG